MSLHINNMSLHINEISSEILKSINAFNCEVDSAEVGTITSIADGVAQISGLNNAMAGELLVYADGTKGMVLNLEKGSVGSVVLGPYTSIRQGDHVRRSGKILEIPVGDQMLGRVVNVLGEPIDGAGPIHTSEQRAIESRAPGVINRTPVCRPLQTGIKSVDSMVPIGRGQRELIIGDRQTGKTSIALDAIINQKDQDVICIYVAIGQKESTVSGVVKTLAEADALSYTTVVSCTAAESAAMQYIAPYAGCAMGEYFMYNGRDVLIIYDDLSKQANAYREISLLLKRPPGREAYPGDVFYIHSRLLERSANLSEDLGGGSMTALPIIETQEGDVSAYIPTNVISITDGQIFLESDLFNAGFRPAINVGVSVSRVGGAAQTKAMKKVAGRLRLDLAQYRELQAFSQFGEDLDPVTKEKLNRGQKTMELLKQKTGFTMPVEDQSISIYCAVNGLLDDVELSSIHEFETLLLERIKTKNSDVYNRFKKEKKLSDEIIKVIESRANEIKEFLANRK